MDLRTLFTRQAKPTGTSRRAFLKTPLAGLVLGVGLPGFGHRGRRAAEVWRRRHAARAADSPKIFVSIAPDGTVSIVVNRSEMGQGVRTSLPRIVADELEADYKRVRVVQAPGDEAKYGNQDTDGSRSTRHWFDADAPLRRGGAADARAGRGQPMARAARSGRGAEPRGRRTSRAVAELGYGALAVAAAKLDVPPRASLKLKDPSKFRYIGKNDTTLTDGPVIVTGKSQFGIDTRLPGMLYAVVARPPVLGGKVKSFDAAEAMKVPGVVKVFAIDGTPPPSEFMPGRRRGASSARTPGRRSRAARRSRSTGTTARTASYDSEAFRGELEAAVESPAARSCATRATPMRRWPAPRRSSKRTTTCRTTRTRRWNARRPRRASSTAPARSGRRASRRRPRATGSRSA